MIYAGTSNRVYTTPTFKVYHNTSPNNALLVDMVNKLRLHNHGNQLSAVRQQLVIIVKWRGTSPEDLTTKINAIYEMHKNNTRAIAMTGSDGSLEVHTVMVRRRSTKEIKFPDGVEVLSILSLKLTGLRGATHDVIMEAMHAATVCGHTCYRNFDFQPIEKHTLETLEAEFTSLTYLQIDDEIIRSKAVPRSLRTSRDNLILAVGEKLLARRREEEKGVTSMKKLCSEMHYEMKSFLHLDQLLVQVCDPVTCIHKSFPLLDFWKEGLFVDTCLIVCGESTMGKTSFVRTMSQVLAMKLQKDSARLGLIRNRVRSINLCLGMFEHVVSLMLVCHLSLCPLHQLRC